MSEQIIEKIYNDSAAVFRNQVERAAALMATMCESPIEVQLGTALCVRTGESSGQYGRTLMVVHNGSVRSAFHPRQWELLCQYEWQKYRIDFALFTELPYPIFIECDGHDFHERTKEQAQRDRERDRVIQTAGIPILRFTGSEIYNRPLQCAEQIVRLAISRIKEKKAPEPKPRFPKFAEVATSRPCA